MNVLINLLVQLAQAVGQLLRVVPCGQPELVALVGLVLALRKRGK